ncbi:MAG: hypothetical protein OEW21_02110 [Betaproteobacteria bacterium]|nr:hypothetical protein [Betaproteobacteria bacterium]
MCIRFIGSVTVALFGLCFAATAAAQARSPSLEADKPKLETLWEWSPYYSSMGLHVPLTDEAFPDGGRMKEADVYRQLFLRSLRPSVLLIEASVYPMPVLGVWTRSHNTDFYNHAIIGGSNKLNVVQIVTAGFQEPWAVSAFLGSQMKFSREDEDSRDTNRGYMGYLVSAGKKHIKENVLIDDDWLEVEWKMKGDRTFKEDRLSWSFRLGGKFNRNPDITDTAYLGITRSSLDFRSPFLSFLYNSRVTLFTEFSMRHPMLLRQEVIFGKKYPSEALGMAWEVDFGLIFERASKYTGPLAPLATTSYTLVIRPNIVF